MVEIVLKQDVANLGFRGDLLTVRPGYFRNYLFPQGMAVKADAAAKKEAEIRRQKDVMRKEQVAANAKAIASQLGGTVLKFKEKVTDKGHLYGSVDEKAIVRALQEQAKIEIDKSHVKMDKHIKELGEYKVRLILNEETELEIQVQVEAA